MQLCRQETIAGFRLALEQRTDKLFKVTYGAQVKTGLTYAEAAREWGECLMHALSCVGAVDNSGV